MAKKVTVVEEILSENDRAALTNRAQLNDAGLFGLNLMASPGAGKTSVIMATIQALGDKLRIGYIDGDLASSIDVDKVAELGVPAVQINTGGLCHLDAFMMQGALPQLSLSELDLLVVENVGNLVCPSGFRLGIHRNVLIASVPEGDDKPYKYPAMYLGVDVMLLNKMDVIEAFDFDMEYFKRGVEILNPGLAFFPVSCKTGEGLDNWLAWVRSEVAAFKEGIVAVYEPR
ncbi:MAG: hydrogenase nickel incorporation protein HypB [Anaerolineaceae bacterium]|nr:MAG: hydrogenase nickel incorporation protein HypB [Anaerolineaceae bacterium]